ncbi:MAG: hypothetical protein K2P75_05210 [Sphingobacteriaceae bacterium]|jgi:hypothetical protein|nr:hypothetical protein [Sphingobacteriaceae bacterium]
MKNINRITFISLILTVLLAVKSIDLLAQSQLKLDDVTKFELLTRAGGLGNDFRKLEVIKKGNVWNCYQIEATTGYSITPYKGRIFVKTITEDILINLLKYVQNPDSEKNPDLFDIDVNELRNRFEVENSIALDSNQKEKLSKLFQDKSILKNAVEKVLTPMRMDDKTYYAINIIAKNDKIILAEASSFASSYYLPWVINEKKSYNPRISLAFEFISNDDVYPIQQKYWFNRNINKEIYRQNFN